MIYNKELTLNNLLVKNQNGNRDWGKLVPRSHNRNELRHMIIRRFRGGNQKIKKSFQSLIVRGEKLFYRHLQYHKWFTVTERFLQLIILGIRSSVGSGFTFQTIVQQNKSLILSSFLSLYPKYS